MAHPDDSILLAYTRRQSLGESWSSIQQHISECGQCSRRCHGYEEISAGLTKTLVDLQCSQHYPPLTEEVFELIDNPAAVRLRREQARRQQSGVGWAKRVSIAPLRLIPIGVALLTVLLTAMALASQAPWLLRSIEQGRMTTNGTGVPSTFSISRHTSSPMATQAQPNNPTPTNNSGSSGSPTATATAGTTPTIKLCSNNDDKHISLTICGYHFKPGTGVRLIVQLSQNVSKSGHPVSVDSHGNFQATWVFGNCKNFPLAVYAQDVDHPAQVSQKLRGSQLGSCWGQTGMQDNEIGKMKGK